MQYFDPLNNQPEEHCCAFLADASVYNTKLWLQALNVKLHFSVFG
jgi:hypothetical protein